MTIDAELLADEIEREGIERVVYGKDLTTMRELNRLLVDALYTHSSTRYVNGGLWLDPKDKPPHLPGEHHSEDVLVVMMDTFECKPAVRIGHVSIGHWRPSGGNGNFDKDILGWMPMPDISQFISPLPHSQEKP